MCKNYFLSLGSIIHLINNNNIINSAGLIVHDYHNSLSSVTENAKTSTAVWVINLIKTASSRCSVIGFQY